MFSPVKQSFPTVCLLYLSQGDSVSQEHVSTPQQVVIDLGNWYFLLLVLLSIVYIMVSVRLATEGLGRATGGHPWAVSVVREPVVGSPSGSTANLDVALVN